MRWIHELVQHESINTVRSGRIVILKKSHSFAFWEDSAVVEDEILFHRTVVEGIITYLDACFWNLYICESASLKTLFSDVLNSVWNFKSFEILAVLERFRLEPL